MHFLVLFGVIEVIHMMMVNEMTISGSVWEECRFVDLQRYTKLKKIKSRITECLRK